MSAQNVITFLQKIFTSHKKNHSRFASQRSIITRIFNAFLTHLKAKFSPQKRMSDLVLEDVLA